MSSIRVTRTEASALIAAEGAETTFIIEGQPGIGKTSIAADVQKLMGGNRPVIMVDCTVVSDGDIAVPVVQPGGHTVRYAVNELFMSGSADNPPIIVLDEFGKAMDGVRNAFSPLMLDRRLFNERMPEGTIVLATKNLAADNVGEIEMMGHTCNRLGFLELAPPTANAWVLWVQRTMKDACPEIIAFASQNPALFQTYTQPSAASNTWIYNPNTPTQSKHFASPRSLASAARTLVAYRAGQIPASAVLPALSGKIGASAAALLWNYVAYAQDMPTLEDIVKNGANAARPNNSHQHFMLASTLATAANNLVAEVKDRGERQRLLNNVWDYVYGDATTTKSAVLSPTAQHLTSFFLANASTVYLTTTQPRVMDGMTTLMQFREFLI